MSDLKDAIMQVKEAETATEPVTEEAIPQAEPEVTVEEEDDNDGLVLDYVPETKPVEEEKTPDDTYADLKSSIMANRPEGRVEAVGEVEPSATNVEGFIPTSIEEWSQKIKDKIEKIGVPAESADIEHNAILTILTRRRKSLILDGFDDVDIEEALEKRFEKEIAAIESKYTGKGATITIEAPADVADKIEFSETDKLKIQKAEKIQLVKVEKKEIPTTKIKKVSKNESKLKYVQGMNTKFISKHSIPLPLTGEFATFRGALFVELLQARAEKNESFHSAASKKAALAYKHYVDGEIYHLKNEKNVTILSYADFIQRFKYHDLDLMVYAVACASSAPMTVADLTCPDCGNKFPSEFPLSSLLDMTSTSEATKKMFDDIIQNHTQLQYMETINTELNTLVRSESPMTKNIYDIGAPSIDRGISILSLVNEDEPTDIYIATMALFVHALYVYDPDEDCYIEFGEDDYEEMFEALKMLPQPELGMLQELTMDIGYTPKFTMKNHCDKCGAELRNDIPVNDLVFFVTPPEPIELKKA